MMTGPLKDPPFGDGTGGATVDCAPTIETNVMTTRMARRAVFILPIIAIHYINSFTHPIKDYPVSHVLCYDWREGGD